MNMHCIGRSLFITFLDLIMLIIKIILYGVIGVWRCSFYCLALLGKLSVLLLLFFVPRCPKQSPVSLFNLLACTHITVSILRNLLWWTLRINMLHFKSWWTYICGGGGIESQKKHRICIYGTVTSEICQISLEIQIWKYRNSLISVSSPMLHKCFFWLSFETVKYFICKLISKVVLLIIFRYAELSWREWAVFSTSIVL